ncbi:S-layer homology domain-containing protein [Tepidibacter mesophilus]|uniref:S-layer homology domain-containing protein n=1 Tax=Tepidibacter mesophilus TaxID=655607 RepID=UPI000C06EF88|nr:S-layer homology domain-containing protein [Tepidibacter mesophilus]
MSKQKRIFRTLSLIFSLTLMLSSTIHAESENISLETKPEGKVEVYKDNIVWMSHDNENWDIYYMNKLTKEQKQITNNPNDQGYPDIWENYIVYQDNKNHIEDKTGYFDIYLYDLNTDNEKKISNIQGNHQNPIICDNKVVWVDNKDGKKDVILYDIKKDTLKRVSSSDAQTFGVTFDGRIIAWMDSRNKSFDIYIYDTLEDKEKRITYSLQDDVDPIVNNGKVVWMVDYNGYSQVYMYDVQTDLKTKLTVGEENHRPIAFSDNNLLLVENDKLVLNNVDKIVDYSMNYQATEMPKQAFLIGDEVVLFDGKSVNYDSLENLLEEAPEEKEDTNKDNSNSRKNSKPIEIIEENYKLVKADQDTTIKSDDGKLTLKIEKGSFDKDVNISIKEKESSKIKGYINITPTYEINIKENVKPLKPIKALIIYKDKSSSYNTKNICTYKLNNNELKIVSSIRNEEDNTLETNILQNDNLALMIYDKKFSDMNNHWSYETVKTIAAHQIINGYEDDSFRPDKEMTRAEFVKVLVSSMGEKVDNYETNFTDIPEYFWASPYINAAYEKGWITGYDGKFNPNESITREQMITIIMRVYRDINNTKVEKSDLSIYSDNNKISSWAEKYMSEAVNLGFIKGYNNELSPNKNTTRAQSATMIYRYLDDLNKL